MPRAILDESHLHPAIREFVAGLHADIVAEVRTAVARHPVVVAGMGGQGVDAVAVGAALSRRKLRQMGHLRSRIRPDRFFPKKFDSGQSGSCHGAC